MKPPRPPWRRISPWVYFRPSGGGKGGSAGVREPRKPRPRDGRGGASLKPPDR
jgi:hypothetical protein